MLLVPFSPSLTPVHNTSPPLRPPRSRTRFRWDHPRALCATQPRREGSEKLQVVFVSTEISPWSKVGGLGDVLGSLPHALAARGHQVMTVCPRYIPYDDIYDSGHLVPIELSDENFPKVSRLYMAHRKGVDHVFVDHLAFQGNGDKNTSSGEKNTRKEDIYPYWWGNEADFETSYSILCQVALAAPCVIWRDDFANYEALPDGKGLIFVANDWPCGILPVWMENYKAKAEQAESISLEVNSSHDTLKQSSCGHPDNGQDQDNSDDKGLHDHNPTAVSLASTMTDVPESPPGLLQEQNIVDSTLKVERKGIVGAKTEMKKALSTKVKLLQGDEKVDMDSSFTSQAPQMEANEVAIPEKKSILKYSQAGMNVGWRDSVQADKESQLWDFQSWVGKRLATSKIAFAIHNMAYQGRSFLESLRRIGCPGALGWKSVQKSFNHANWLKIGVTWSDAVLTVSPGYALELVRGGLEASGVWNAVQKIGVKGIRNGIDTNVWDPQKDKHLTQILRYSINDVERGKHCAKIALQEKLGLEVSQSTPLFGFIGRLDHQKGVDIILSAATSLLRGPTLPKPIKLEDGLEGIDEEGQVGQLQLAMLGSGDQWLEEGIKSLQYAFPGSAAGVAGFNEELAHQMLAGCDYLLVPSRFEPCGLVALCAARYGCIPIVAPVGGLNDLILIENIGYTLHNAPDKVPLKLAVSDMICCINQVSSKYGSTEFEAMRKKCMELDVSWDTPAIEWEEVLEGLHDRN